MDTRPPRDAEQAFSLFNRLVLRYPDSEYAEDSRQRMVYLKNRLAAYENEVARYYMKVGAWVAALNRATNAVEQYHGADSNYESLQIMIKCYENLGMFDLSLSYRKEGMATSSPYRIHRRTSIPKYFLIVLRG